MPQIRNPDADSPKGTHPQINFKPRDLSEKVFKTYAKTYVKCSHWVGTMQDFWEKTELTITVQTLQNCSVFLEIWIYFNLYGYQIIITLSVHSSLSDRIITNWKHKTWRVKLKIGITQVSWTPSTLEKLTNGHICECNISWLRGLWVQILLRPKFFQALISLLMRQLNQA